MDSLPGPTEDFYFPADSEYEEHLDYEREETHELPFRTHAHEDRVYKDQTSPTLFPRTRANNYVKKELTRIYTKEVDRLPAAVQTQMSPIKSSARVTAARWEQENNDGPSDGGQWIFDPFVERDKPQAQKFPASRDDILLLTKSYDSMLVRWANQLPKPPENMIRESLKTASVQKFLEVLQPELKMSMVVEKELIKQICVVCSERGNLGARLFRRYRRYVKGLCTLAKNIQMERARVQEFIPQVRENRKILIHAIDALEVQARKAIETDELLDWSGFENQCKILAQNGGNVELPTLRRLEKCVVELQTGRSRLKNLHQQEKEKLLKLESIIDNERINSQEKAKLMHKKLAALEHQDGVTSYIRENRIKMAVQDAFHRANAVAANTIERLEADKARLHMAVLTARKQMAQYKFENDKETWDFTAQCTPETMSSDIAEAKEKAKQKRETGRKGC